MIHHLTTAERLKLALVNKMLTQLTEPHETWCDCGLCEARMLTDVQDEESFHVKCECDVRTDQEIIDECFWRR